VTRTFGAVVLGTALAMSGFTARAATLEVRGPQDGGFATQIVSLREARFVATLRQQYDFSCGSAAIATLLTHHYGHPVTEREVFERMFAQGDRAKIRKQGFSLLDMKRYLASHGMLADGFEQPIEKLAAEKLPGIVLLSERGYKHFVVVKGIARDRVLIGDPAMGTRTMSLERFRSVWMNGILFVVHNRREQARFDRPEDWRVAPGAPLHTAIDRERALESLPARGVGAP
jgi:uncharacterized protein